METDDPQNPQYHNTWRIRSPTEAFVAQNVYVGYNNLFTLKVYHRGIFTKLPKRKYVDGSVSYVDYCDIDEFSVHEIDFNGKRPQLYIPDLNIFYHFQLPGQDLDSGLTPLGNDGDVLCLAKYVTGNKVIKLYIEHGFTRIADYLSPPKSSSVVIEEIEDVGKTVVNANIPRRKLKVAKNLSNSLKEAGEGSGEPNSRVNVGSEDVEVRLNGIEDIDNRMQLEVNVGSNDGVGVNLCTAEGDVAVVGSVGVVVGGKEVVDGNVGSLKVNGDFSYDIDNADFAKDFPVEPCCNPASPTRTFKRVYICLGPLKEGYKECRREFLGLDGAFIKGPYPGQMLTVVGQDPNFGIYPLAYAIVEIGTKIHGPDTWKRVYTHIIEPINGRDLWPKSPCPTTLTPPLYYTPIGRPNKKRRKNQVELQDDAERVAGSSQRKKRKTLEADALVEVDNGGKMTRKWKTTTCKKCGAKGHNSRGCGKTKRGKQAKKPRQPRKGKRQRRLEIDRLEMDKLDQVFGYVLC